MNSYSNDYTWTVPIVFNYATWQTVKSSCIVTIQSFIKQINRNSIDSVNNKLFQKQTNNFILNWQACQVVDSSALAFILYLKKQFPMVYIKHQYIPNSLNQLAQLYEVSDIICISS